MCFTNLTLASQFCMLLYCHSNIYVIAQKGGSRVIRKNRSYPVLIINRIRGGGFLEGARRKVIECNLFLNN